MFSMKAFLVFILAYLFGSISFGIIVTKWAKKIDIRNFGSGNTGFTNVLRVVGKGPAALVLLGDALKGSLGVGLGFYVGGGSYEYAVLGGLAAMLGHTYPLYFGLRGGKGVATGLGVIATLAPDVTAMALLVFLVTVLISRYVSLGSVLAALSVPLFLYICQKPTVIFIFGIWGPILILYNHRVNLVRLFQGKENKIRPKKEKNKGQGGEDG